MFNFPDIPQSELDKQIEFAEDKLKAFQLECEWVDVRKEGASCRDESERIN